LERAFAAEGVKLCWREYVGGMQLIDALQNDGLTLGLVGEVPPIFAQAARQPMMYLAASAPAPDNEAILVPATSNVTTVEALRGKTVLLSRGSNVQYFLILALEAAGLTYSDVRVIYAPPDRTEALFASGQVDAWATWEPFLGKATRAGRARILRSARGLTANTSYYVGARDFATEHPKLVGIFLDQLREVARWAEVQPAQAAALLAGELGLPPSAASHSLTNLRVPEPFDAPHILAQQNIADTFHRLGIVDTRIDVRLACSRRTAHGRELPVARTTPPGAQL
jgi:sulfonate transport system substrate-binding protein